MRGVVRYIILTLAALLCLPDYGCGGEFPKVVPFDIWKGTGEKQPEIIMTPYLATLKGKENKEHTESTTSIIICGGGSYFWHNTRSEGQMVAEWLNSKGISAFILNYRTSGFLATYGSYNHSRECRYRGMLKDVKRAIALLRKNSKEWNIGKIGIMGFSAGGHLALMSAHFADADSPDFVAAIYPVVTMSRENMVHKRSRRGLMANESGKKELRQSLSMEKNIPAWHPPVFLLACKDDKVVDVRNSQILDSALTANDIEHIYKEYEKGGHGFGADPTLHTEETMLWMDEFEKWLQSLI